LTCSNSLHGTKPLYILTRTTNTTESLYLLDYVRGTDGLDESEGDSGHTPKELTRSNNGSTSSKSIIHLLG